MALRDLPCTIDGCDSPQVGKGLCSKHWQRLKFHGDPLYKSVAKHGMSNLPEYRHWGRMHERCYSVNHRSYPRYGGRGIKVADRWNGLGGFANFLADMGPRPSPKHTVDRIDGDRDYGPDNCRWATVAEQNNNRGDYNVRLTVGDETKTVAEWAHSTGLPVGVIRTRLKRGWTHEQAVLAPTRGRRDRQTIRKTSSKLTEADVAAIRASDLSYKELAERFGVSRSHISGIKCGIYWKPLPDALESPSHE